VFNIFEAIKHRNENPQCYRVDVIDEIVEDNSREPRPTQPMERIIVNSIECCDKDEDIEMKECVKQLETSKQEVEPVKLENILCGKNKGEPLVSEEGGRFEKIHN